MSRSDPADVYSPEPNILERKAAEYLGRCSDADGAARDATVRTQARKMAGATRWAVGLAATAGIFSGGIIGGSEVWIRQGLFDGMEDVDWREQLPYWVGFFAFTGVVSAVEILFLYWVALRGIVRVTKETGHTIGNSRYPGLFARGLARGALEFPNPRVHIFGVDPYAYVSGWRLLAKNIGYKMKVGVTSFLLRVFLRRVAARMAVRGMVPLIAGPLYAAWNAFIVWRIMNEARIRTLGPRVVDGIVDEAFGDGPPDGAAAEVILQGVAEMLKRGGDAHPNQVYLLCRIREALGREEDIDADWNRHSPSLADLNEGDRSRLLALLTVAILIGSSVARRQKRLLEEACRACCRRLSDGGLKTLQKKVKSGHRLGLEYIDRSCPREG
ncbi:MAG: LBF_2804 family protein [Alphaproteobacteria bacterium]